MGTPMESASFGDFVHQVGEVMKKNTGTASPQGVLQQSPKQAASNDQDLQLQSRALRCEESR